MAYGPYCLVCRDRECPGCCDDDCDDDEASPEAESLGETPEGQGWLPDQRDATPEPPAYLDPLWVIKMRRLVKKFSETGVIDLEEWKRAA